MAAKPTITTVTSQAENNAFQVNTATDELADAIATCLERDGTDSMAGSLNMDNNKIINIAEGSADTDAARLIDISDAVLTSGSVTGKDTVTIVGADSLLVVDASDSDALKNGLVSDLLARAAHTGTQTASTISDFDTEVSNNASVVANTAKVTNATHTGDVTGSTALTIANDAVTYSKLQNIVSNNVLLGNDNGAGSAVQELTASEVKTLLAIVAADISDFDTEVSNNASVTANTAKVTNATHTGEVTGDGALTIADNVVDAANLKLDSGGTNDYVLTYDDTKSGNMEWRALPTPGTISDTAYTRAGWNGDTTNAATKNALSDAFYEMVRWQDADTGGTDCIFAGSSGNTTNTGASNSYTGHSSGAANTSGVANNGYGRNSLAANTTANNCCAFGNSALTANVDGERNLGFGNETLEANNTSASDNCAFGHQSLTSLNNSAAIKNCAFGNMSGDALTSGYENCIYGYNAATALTSGIGNVIIGSESGGSLTTADDCVYIGRGIGTGTTLDNRLAIGRNADGNAFISGAMTSSAASFGVRGVPYFLDIIGTSVGLSENGSFSIEFTNNTTITFRGRGDDGVTRTGTVTLS